ncbi:hypothetical protein LIER_02439 [Lithospermum erythrorhizon]|uniref:Uncharacterized protein n=1 Tax=Lithospermum erythrorhizon TaxID=34254 RepID=A0AAV3NQQ0_LITER
MLLCFASGFFLCDAHYPLAFVVVLLLCLTVMVTYDTIPGREFALYVFALGLAPIGFSFCRWHCACICMDRLLESFVSYLRSDRYLFDVLEVDTGLEEEVTWKATRLDRAEPYFFNDKVSHTILDRAFFLIERTGRTVTFPIDSTSNSPPVSYKTWLGKLFLPEYPHCSSRKHGKDSEVEDKDPKHARGTRQETSSSRGSRVVPLVRPSSERVAVPGPTPLVIPDKVVGERVVEVTSSASEQEHTELVDTGESPECFTTEVVESCPPVLPIISRAQEVESILHAGASPSCPASEMILKEEEGVMSTFQVLTRLVLGAFPDIRDKLQGFFQKVKEAGTTLSAASQEELEQEAAEWEVHARELRVRVQEQRSVVTQLDHETADTSRQIHTLEGEIRAERAKHIGSLTADID